jgi:hypothetical protein
LLFANALALNPYSLDVFCRMGIPKVPPALNEEQLIELNSKLSHMRHEINNQLSLVVAALELIRFRPEMRERMINTLGEQPPKIMAEVAKFTAEFEQTFGITRE